MHKTKTLRNITTLLLIQWMLLEGTQAVHCKDGTDEYCAKCLPETNNSSGCAVCFNSYIQSSENKCVQPSTAIENCFAYDEDSKECTACLKPYYLTEAKKCETVTIENCLHPATKTTCAECDGYLLKEDGTCDKNTVCSVEGCSTCSKPESTELCIACKSAYVFSKTNEEDVGGKCEKLVSSLDGCAAMLGSKCVVCKYGYYVSSKLGADFMCKRTKIYAGVSIYSIGMFVFMFVGIVLGNGF
jgi:hypothetical protein